MNLDLNLQIAPRPNDALIASYTCPCGCNPRVSYPRGSETLTDDCCCGNQFAVGPDASTAFASSADRREQVAFDAPWGGQLEAAWKLVMVGSQPESGHDHDHDHGHDHDHDHDHGQAGHGDGNGGARATSAKDPVCGMTVDIATATARELTAEHEGTAYYFCGRGCKLDFGEAPGTYLDPSYVPSM